MDAIFPGVNSPEDIKKLNIRQLERLAWEIRQFMIKGVSRTGGHLASNLGVVELTLALHKVFTTPRDRIIWDVGHQTYVHKIITGRKERFNSLRKLGGLSGFPKVQESPHDCFNTGHSSTAISAALGIAKGRDLKNEDYHVVAVVGDGALTGGMAFEALNDAGRSTSNFIVILNDNEMSISRNVGGLSRYLSKIRTEPIYFKVKEDIDLILKKIPAIGMSAARALNRAKGSIKYMIMPGIIFEELGFKYLGPINGHNIAELIEVFSRAKTVKGPVFIHVVTQKGKGYSHAERQPQKFHGISPFDVETGEITVNNGGSYSDCFGQEMVKLAEADPRVVAITAAMPDGTGLLPFSRKFPNRFFDVGIAEQHAVTFAAGLARTGFIPVVAIYSSFLQRAYDQIIHDVAIQNFHVVFAIDRAGVVGEDGETHQGLYDIAYLNHVPNMTIMAPVDYSEFRAMLKFALFNMKGPVAIRYPKGRGPEKLVDTPPIQPWRGCLVFEGRDVTLVAAGSELATALKVREYLSNEGISAEIINPRFIKPLDLKLISSSVKKTGKVAVLEDGTVSGGLGSSILQSLKLEGNQVKARLFAFPDEFIPHGTRDELFKLYGLDPESIAGDIMRMLS